MDYNELSDALNHATDYTNAPIDFGDNHDTPDSPGGIIKITICVVALCICIPLFFKAMSIVAHSFYWVH